jgi:uncharacterized membrane protein YdfJ with MMPL/SSD domain
MRTVVLVLGAWVAISLIAGLVFAVGSSLGFRRGYEDGYEAGRASLGAQRREGKQETG